MRKSVLAILGVILLLVGFVGGSVLLLRQAEVKSERDDAVAREIKALQKNAEELSMENEKLSEKIQYLQTDAFKEKLAKDKLNYVAEGEELVIIKSGSETRVMKEEPQQTADSPKTQSVPNYIKWWNEFF